MGEWFERTVLDTGRLPLFCFFVSLIVAFLLIRVSTRLIRARVRWWPGNITVGGLHIHHAVLGVVGMVLGGVLAIAAPEGATGWRAAAAAVFGAGTAAVLDEFALILRLRDVYWSAEGRASVNAVFVAIAMSGLLVMGVRPSGVDDLFTAITGDGGVWAWVLGVFFTVLNLGMATLTVLKGKIFTGLFGVFFWLLLIVGAIRLARPSSPYARWYYTSGDGEKLARAQRRERWLREPVARVTTWLSDLIAGRPGPPG